MEALTAAFNRITRSFNELTNFKFVGNYSFKPHPPNVHQAHIDAHKKTLAHAMNKFLFPNEIYMITEEYRRSEVSEDAILADFFNGDVSKHEIVFDQHLEYGLQCMYEAFKPPRPARPCHLNDVEHHYPFKWQVNAEAPFSTDEYFLTHRKNFEDFYNFETQQWTKHVDPLDMERRYSGRLEKVFGQVTPAKFGFMKNMIFSWTRTWHHVIKSGFHDLAGFTWDNPYLKNRFIFPMLLHTKTAIVKKDDPNKMRTIWGCSKPWIIADTMLWWEYIAWVKLNPGLTPMLWGYETFTGGWFRLNHHLYCGLIQRSFVTLDWSRFDKKAYFSLIYRIMLKTREFLDFSSGYVPNVSYPTTTVKPIKFENLFIWTLENLFHAPIVLPDGRMYVRNFAGIPSGLFITQLLDSWYNFTMIATLLSAIGLDPKTCIIKVQGDDSVIRLAVLIPPQYHEDFLIRLQELADYYFGSVLSESKSEVRNELNGVEVLSYRNNNGLPYRDEIVMLAQYYHTKARNPTPEITMAQAIGFAYASCGNNYRVLWVLQDIYEYYLRNGFEPNPAGLTLVFGNSPDRFELEIPLDHFPSVFEIKKYHMCTEYRNKHQENKTWPRDYFLFPPCI